jgi:hypothetical protein
MRTSNKAIVAAKEATSQITAAREATAHEVTGFLTDAELIGVLRDPREQAPCSRAESAHIFKVRLLLNSTEGVSIKLVDMLIDVRNAARGGLVL